MRGPHPRSASPSVVWGCGLALFLAASVVSAQGASQGAWLRWDLENLPPAPGTPHALLCQAVSVSWLDAHDRVRWTARLPARMRDADQGDCDCRRADDGGACASELREYRARPRASVPPFVVGVLREGHVLAVADMSGVLLLDVRSGKVLLDWEAPPDAGARLFVDEGRFTLEGMKECSGVLERGRMLRRCGTRLVYFNGSAVAVFHLGRPRLEAATRVEASHVVPSAPSHVKARIPVGSGTFVLNGRVYL